MKNAEDQARQQRDDAVVQKWANLREPQKAVFFHEARGWVPGARELAREREEEFGIYH